MLPQGFENPISGLKTYDWCSRWSYQIGDRYRGQGIGRDRRHERYGV